MSERLLEQARIETQGKSGGARVRFPPPLLFLMLIGAGLLAQRKGLPLSIPLAFWPRIVSGVVVALAGLTLVIAARLWFARTGQSPVPWKPSPQLILKGPYRFTRNPMYVGVTLFQVGLGILFDNLWISALALIGLLIVHFIAVWPEEAYLAEKFGDSYLRYKAAVRRYL